MKRIFAFFLLWSALLMTGVGLAACSSSSDDEPLNPTPEPGPKTGTFTVSVKASLGGATRGTLTKADNVYNLTWTADDRVDVKKGGTTVGTLRAESTGSAYADLIGTLTGTFNVNDELTLTYPKAEVSYTGQKGTLADLGANYAFATAKVKVTAVNGSVITIDDEATFAAQHAIVKFTLKDEKGTAINATSFTIEGCDQTVSVTSASGASELYVSVPATSGKNLTLTASTGSDEYKYNRTNVTFTAGKHYTQNVTMGQKPASYNADNTPLTFQAISAGTITYTAAKSTYTVEYNMNNTGWTSYSSAISVAVGDVVSFQGNNATYYDPTGDGTPSTFTCSSPCYIYGNVMSLIGLVNNAPYTPTDKFTANNAFLGMFKGNVNMRSHPYKDLVLPATTLTEQCYRNMFYGCTGLTRSAILADATGTDNAYQYMYYGCSNLSEVTCNAEYNANYFAGWLTGVASSGTFYTTTAHKTVWESFRSANISGWTVVGK